MITVETKIVSSLNEFERRFALPVQRTAETIAPMMVERIRRGQGAFVPMAPLGAYSRDDMSDRSRFWVAPGRPQPKGDGWLATLSSGSKAGWAIYRSYRSYAALVGHGAPRDLDETGAFLASIAVRVQSPSRTKIAPYGSHRGPSGKAISNTSLGYQASKREPQPLLYPSPDEVRAAAAIVFAEVEAQAVEAAAIAGVGTSARRRVEGFQRRAAKMLAAHR